MRVLIIALLLLIASVFIGIYLVKYPGFLFIVLEHWMVQMPLWFALLSVFLMLVLFYFLITCIDSLQFFFFRIKNWWRFRKEQRSYSKTQHGLAFLIEGRWNKAEKFLLAGVSQTSDPLINYLAAAKAAQEQSAYARRDEYIQKAYQTAPHAELAIGLVQAELDIEQGQFEHAAATLNHLKQDSPRHPRVLKLLEKVYVRVGDWQHLHDLLPSLRKAKVLTGTQTEIFEKNLFSEILRHASDKNLEEVQALWQTVPRYLKKDPEVVAEYVKQLMRCHPILVTPTDYKEIEDLIRKCLKHRYSSELVQLYGCLPFNNLNQQLVIAGGWLKLYGQKPDILLLLGKLCAKIKLWGKARDYFEKCLAQGPHPEASLEYGKLLEQLNDVRGALEVYRTGLSHQPSICDKIQPVSQTESM